MTTVADKYKALYLQAKSLAENTPQVGRKLAGNCTTVSYSMLNSAREALGKDIELCVGWIEYKGERKWYFSDDDIKKWKSGVVRPTNMVHCWLQSDDHLIDLTLASTLYEIERIQNVSLIPLGIDYMDNSVARKLSIRHKKRLSGDNILFDLNF
ncbi:hypothetical protein [Marinagarivorans cellulosilyticus]|uniref:Uncharacterized protein n=1 Tax=Marinagarivorans cellulosilyticus TaxID=2721545 RepID=A0AAN1WHI1_9GAMM|nr:hypothetical protein [Marinagarivorans cellulosilyticus]BCD97716.1 hypothetical protein MARGE09_P1917 [Marinagarivorans cellulosilyticus]